MTARRSCPPAPGPLEDYAQRFDALFSSLAQRRGLRDYLQGLLLPRDRNKTLTGLAGAEPIIGAQHREVQRLQWFLSESAWDHEQVNDRRVAAAVRGPGHRPPRWGRAGDRRHRRPQGRHQATAHVARQYLGSVGKIDNGIVAVTSLWADERCYWPVHAVPYTPASRLPGGERDPGFQTKPQLAVELVRGAQQAGIGFRAVVADCVYGDNPGFTKRSGAAGIPFVLALKPRKGTWAPAEASPHPDRGGQRARLAQPFLARAVAAGRPPLPRRPHRDLVGGRRPAWRLGPGPAAAAGGGQHRPRTPARAQHLVSADQPAPTRQPPRPAGRPGRHRAPVRAAQLGRAGLQAGQRRTRLGRLPGPQRPGDPPALGAGVLRVQLLLAGLPGRTTPSAPVPGRPDGRAGGAGDRSSRRNRPRGCRGQWRCARCGPG